MIRLICIKLPQVRPRASPLSYGYLFTTSSHKTYAEPSPSTDPQSPTLSYLQNSCGLSLESAISASKKLNIDIIHNPDSVMNLLRTHGLTRNHIKNLITNRPSLLSADLENTLKPNLVLFRALGFSSTSLAKILYKDPRVLETNACTVVEFFKANGFSDKQIATLTMKRPTLYLMNTHTIFKPKLDFLKSLGLSESDVAKILSGEPYILERSLEKQITPCIQVLRHLLGNDENVLKVIKGCYRVLECNLEKLLLPNISVLARHGVPQSLIFRILVIQPKSLLMETYRFSDIVLEVVKLGFDPNNLLFVLAIRSMAVMSKTLWEQKLEAYGRFGLSKDEIYSAFRLQPMCMITSEKKITKLMNFFVNKLCMKPSMVSKNPNILLLSLEKRIIPRCSVLQLLMSKELIKGNISLIHVFRMTEKNFVEKLVRKYQGLVPEVVKAHQGKIEFKGFPISVKI